MIPRRVSIPFLCVYAGVCVGCSAYGTPAGQTSEQLMASTHTQATLSSQGVERTATAIGLSSSPPPIDSGTPSPASTMAEGCTDRGSFVEDVTVRDSTPFLPREKFVKIWRMLNAGTCTWTKRYAIQFVGGDQMEALDQIPMPFAVRPGSELEIAVDMVAPETPGNYQGFWKLVSDEGSFFGIGPGGNASFWVKIAVVAEGPASLTPVAVPTAAIAAQGVLSLGPAAGFDLDIGAPGSPDEDDLRQEVDEGSGRVLAPVNGTTVGPLSSENVPATPGICAMSLLSGSALPLSDLFVGDMLCFRTNRGRIGTLTLTALGDPLTANFITWSP